LNRQGSLDGYLYVEAFSGLQEQLNRLDIDDNDVDKPPDEHAARWLRAPVFSKDELEATLWRAEIRRDANSGWAAYELVTALAEGQLRRGQSAILDSVATLERIRSPWRALAVRYGAVARVVEAICSDEAIWRARLRTRRRYITGWPELTVDEALEVAGRFEPWTEDHLVLDAVNPLANSLAALRAYVGDQ
jgi:predicted kinase